MRIPLRKPSFFALAAALASLVVACAIHAPDKVHMHRWWAGLGPVLPHDDFPGNCSLCHVGEGWHSLVEDFQWDHEKETGVALEGAHGEAQCLRCHNDRGPVAVFMARGCGGCHEDIHTGELGQGCTDCHQQETWRPVGMVEMHYRTRFPLIGMHANVSCRRCHPGAEVGQFIPTDTECLTCHRNDLNRTTNHAGLGWVDNCHRCHQPFNWNNAQVN